MTNKQSIKIDNQPQSINSSISTKTTNRSMANNVDNQRTVSPLCLKLFHGAKFRSPRSLLHKRRVPPPHSRSNLLCARAATAPATKNIMKTDPALKLLPAKSRMVEGLACRSFTKYAVVRPSMFEMSTLGFLCVFLFLLIPALARFFCSLSLSLSLPSHPCSVPLYLSCCDRSLSFVSLAACSPLITIVPIFAQT